jgi:glycosyltransferase involved in cell wall biosynthesis
MRIIQITPGSGDNFYCENCLRDAALVKAMRQLGHDVLMVPLYLPLQTDKEHKLSNTPIFFGGLNVWLRQKSALFRRTPRWLDRVFDSPRLLGWVARRAGMTSASDLSETTISMLQGENGRQAKELDRLIEWLRLPENKADVICLSNALLAGLARPIKSALGQVAVVCLLQDEDGFLDALGSPHSQRAWQIVADRCRDVDMFIAVSAYYAEVMRRRLNLAADRVEVAYMGIALDGFDAPALRPAVPTIGYLSRMCPSRGLDNLIEAFVILKRQPKLKNVKLRIAGGKSPGDEAFIEQMRRRLSTGGVLDDVEFLPEFNRRARLEFLKGVSVLSVPEKYPVAYGLYVLEALAAGVPVVEPAIGVFPELLEMLGGGVLCKPNDAEGLAKAIESVLLNADYAEQLARRGRQAVFEKFNIEQTAGQMLRIYKEIVQE